jgi:UDP:flavonoid glycosyltransferase YjiC (YdhE family)
MSSSAKRRFVFVATGTHGVILPLLAIAAELVRRGYPCQLLANEPFRRLADARGVAFTSIAPAQFNDVVSTEVTFGTYVFPSYPRVRQFFAACDAAGERPAAVINVDETSASNAMCDLYSIPRVRIWVNPSKLRSVRAPSWPLARHLAGHFPYTFSRYHLPKVHAEALIHPLMLKPLNHYRALWGLPSVATIDDAPSVAEHLALFPDWYAAPAEDWPRGIALLGFPLPAPRASLEPVVLNFIRDLGSPLVFTPGTGVASSEEFFRQASACCAELGLPGIFLSLHHEPRALRDERIIHVPFADLGALLPHARLIVHNGGIGTVARALEAGIPQIICPRSYDQPDNGRRVEKLGVGAVVEAASVSGASLARCAASLLRNASTALKLSSLSREVRSTCAVSAAADRLERGFGHHA